MNLRLVIIALLISSPMSTMASHAFGGELNWKRISRDTLEVTAVIIRDCNGVEVAKPFLNYSCSGIKQISNSAYKPVDITPICQDLSQCNRCDSRSCSFKFGLEKHEIVYLLDISQALKNGCCNLKISFSVQERNGNITTGASLEDFYTEATINICQTPYLNSPELNSQLAELLCVGSNHLIEQNRINIDTLANGRSVDSLYFSLTKPLQSENTYTTWKSLYTYEKPLSYLGMPKSYPFTKFPYGFHLDSLTGDLSFRPMKVENTIMSINVDIYRNGNKIGEKRREYGVVVIKCASNDIPKISVSGFSQKMKICAGKPHCFTVEAQDKDSLDSLSFTTDFSVEQASISIDTLKGSRRPRLNVCWTPSKSDISNNPYTFKVKVSDGACPISGSDWANLDIFVVEEDSYFITPTVQYVPLVSYCGLFKFSGKSNVPVPIEIFDWYLFDTLRIYRGYSDSTSFNYELDSNGVYPITIRTLINNCWKEFHDTFRITQINKPVLNNIKDVILCTNRTFLDTIKVNGGTKPFKINWQIPDQSKSSGSSIIQTNFPNTDYNSYKVKYSVHDKYSCSDTKEFNIITKKLESGNLQQDTQFCNGLISTLKLNKFISNSNYIGEWSGNGLQNDTFYSNRAGFGKHQLRYFGEDSAFCVVDSAYITVKNSVNIELQDSITVCSFSGEKYFPLKPKGGSWNSPYVFTRNDSMFINTNKNKNGIINLIYVYSDSITCQTQDTLISNWKFGTKLDVGSKLDDICQNQNPLILPDRGLPKGGIWYGLGDTSQDLKIDRQIIGNTYYNYEFTDTNGCTSSNKLYVEVLPVNKIKIMKSDTICIETSYRKGLHAEPKGGNWIGSFINKVNKDSSFISFHNSKLGLHKYYYKFTNTNGCKSIDSVFFQVVQQPVSNFIASPDSGLIPLNVSFKNYSQYSAQYFWDFGNGDTSQQFEPKTTYKDTGVYLVELKTLDSFGFCQHSLKQKVIAGEKNNSVRREFHQVEIFPNPAKNRIWLSNPQNELLTFVIFDHTGKRCKEIITQSSKSINISDLSKGHYIYQTTNSSGLTNQGKLIIE